MKQFVSNAEADKVIKDVNKRIAYHQMLCQKHEYGSDEYNYHDCEYVKAVAQYNILLKVYK